MSARELHGMAEPDVIEQQAAMIASLRRTLQEIKDALETFGEPDSTRTHPLEYACCPDGVDNIGDRIEKALNL